MEDGAPKFFEKRRGGTGTPRANDIRNEYQRDRARIIHSAAFRRLQGKTQVMGVGEGDFHRTRLTHSIECAQLGNGLLQQILLTKGTLPDPLLPWRPDRDLIEAACFAHDLGHPPFGHGGEKALQSLMAQKGGFEGNGQTLRIVTRLEKYSEPGIGLDPTRRLILAVLKYPVAYSLFASEKYRNKPPKCYFDEEQKVVDWALEDFSADDRDLLTRRDEQEKPKYRTFDSSIMELADDIAYGIHDIEDIVARHLVDRDELTNSIKAAFDEAGGSLSTGVDTVSPNEVCACLFDDSYKRKQMVSRLVNLFLTQVRVNPVSEFEHPLLAYQAGLPDEHGRVLKRLRNLTLKLVASKAKVQQLESRGQMVVTRIYESLLSDPEKLIPQQSWETGDNEATTERRVCDYVAGMTDSYAEKVYRRLFEPGYGSSADEL